MDAPASKDGVDRMGFLLMLRRRGIADAALLRAMDEVPREHFIDDELGEAAYADQALPIACGQTISKPSLVAYMTERLDLRPHHRVLEIGTGSGYHAAILSRLAGDVVSIERFRSLVESARARLSSLGCANVELLHDDGLAAAPGRGPFDRIIVTAAAAEIPENLLDQMADDGVMVLPLGPDHGPQRIVKLSKTREGIERDELMAVRLVPLIPGVAKEL
jgi:protein-L-isoaspartate(D-aspartate) O-methyltransferase